MTLLFERLNLTRNPFETPCPEEWSRLAVPVPGFDPEELANWLREPRRVVLILGESGRGKSTHMRALHQYFPDSEWVYVAPGDRPHIPKGDVVFIDELQRVGWWRRKRLWRRGTSYVIGSHEDYGAEMTRSGLEVRSWRIGGLTEDRLRMILERRIERSRRDDGPVPRFSEEAITRLVELFGDDIRSLLDVLYEYFQRLDAPGLLTLEGAAFEEALAMRVPSSHREDE